MIKLCPHSHHWKHISSSCEVRLWWLGQAYYYSIIHTIWIAPEVPVAPIHRHCPPWNLFLVCVFLNVLNISHQYVVFLDWFFSFSNMHFNFSHVFSWLNGSFLFNEPNTVSLSECTTFTHSSAEEHLCCFQVLSFMDHVFKLYLKCHCQVQVHLDSLLVCLLEVIHLELLWNTSIIF